MQAKIRQEVPQNQNLEICIFLSRLYNLESTHLSSPGCDGVPVGGLPLPQGGEHLKDLVQLALPKGEREKLSYSSLFLYTKYYLLALLVSHTHTQALCFIKTFNLLAPLSTPLIKKFPLKMTNQANTTMRGSFAVQYYLPTLHAKSETSTITGILRTRYVVYYM